MGSPAAPIPSPSRSPSQFVRAPTSRRGIIPCPVSRRGGGFPDTAGKCDSRKAMIRSGRSNGARHLRYGARGSLPVSRLLYVEDDEIVRLLIADALPDIRRIPGRFGGFSVPL